MRDITLLGFTRLTMRAFVAGEIPRRLGSTGAE